MFKKWSLFIPSLLLVFVVIFLLVEKPNAPKEVTFAPLFQILGKFVQTADVAFSRILSAGEWDEATFGAELKKRFDDEYEISSDSIYMNELLVDLIGTSRKDFDYTVYVDQYMAPNAFAMPGGVIVFSAELLELLETEAQVASILSHEIAHIELDHCLNAFKFEMAKDKYDLEAMDLFSTLYNVLIGLPFSKTQEDEADDYAFNYIVRNTDYQPRGLSESFQMFIEAYGEEENTFILREFFQSHPDMVYRREKYYEKALNLPDHGLKYRGKANLQLRISKGVEEFDDEWEDF